MRRLEDLESTLCDERTGEAEDVIARAERIKKLRYLKSVMADETSRFRKR